MPGEDTPGAILPAGPPDVDDITYALKGTGRVPVSDPDRASIGPLAGRLPLIG